MDDKTDAPAAPGTGRVWFSRLLNGGWRPRITEKRRTRNECVRVLAVMRADTDFATLSDVAGRMDWRVTLTSNPEYAMDVATSDRLAVILCDRELSADWKQLLKDFIRAAPHAAVILLSNSNESLLWEEVTNNGGYDVLRKPLCGDAVSAVVSRAVTYWRLR